MRKQMTCAALVLLMGAAWMGSARADELPRTVRVTGEGKANAPPDMATIQTGVVTQAPTTAEALAANNRAMEDILAILKKHQVVPKDVQTSHFNVQPIHKRDEEGRMLPEVDAYQITNQLSVRVRDLEKLGEVLDALVKAGSNQISGIGFGIADPMSTLDKARKEAIANAIHRAALYAQGAGVRLGRVQTITEQSVTVPQPRQAIRFQAMAAKAADAVPVAAGEEEFRINVDVVFALEDAE